jgi:hypothetical protein
MWHVWVTRSAYRVLEGRRDGRTPLGKPGCRWEDVLKWFFNEWDQEKLTGLIWLRIVTVGGHL